MRSLSQPAVSGGYGASCAGWSTLGRAVPPPVLGLGAPRHSGTGTHSLGREWGSGQRRAGLRGEARGGAGEEKEGHLLVQGIHGTNERPSGAPCLSGGREKGPQVPAVDLGTPQSHALRLLALLQGRYQAQEQPLETSLALLNALRPLPPPREGRPFRPPLTSNPLVYHAGAHCEASTCAPSSEGANLGEEAACQGPKADSDGPCALGQQPREAEAHPGGGAERAHPGGGAERPQPGCDAERARAGGEEQGSVRPDGDARSHWVRSGRLLGESLWRLQGRSRWAQNTDSTGGTGGTRSRGGRSTPSTAGWRRGRGRRRHRAVQRRALWVGEGAKAEAAEQLIRRPPRSVLQFCQDVAYAASLEGARLGELLSPWYTAGTHAVPDVEGSRGARCQLTASDGACKRFASRALEAYFAFLFCAVSRFSAGAPRGTGALRAPLLARCPSEPGPGEAGRRGHAGGVPPFFALSRFDLFHAHVFVDAGGRVGALFHAREYPALDARSFPFPLGFCQAGSWVQADELMPCRNILWLSPYVPSGLTASSGLNGAHPCLTLPRCLGPEHVPSRSAARWHTREAPHLEGVPELRGALRSRAWDPAEGVLLMLDGNQVPGLVHPGLEPLYTVLESNFGRTVCEINFFPTSYDGWQPQCLHPIYVVPFET